MFTEILEELVKSVKMDSDVFRSQGDRETRDRERQREGNLYTTEVSRIICLSQHLDSCDCLSHIAIVLHRKVRRERVGL